MSVAKIKAFLEQQNPSGQWRGDCPVCGYHDTFVMSVTSSSIRLHCFNQCSWAELKSAISSVTGKDSSQLKQSGPIDPKLEAAKSAEANQLWDSCQPVPGTIAEKYLSSRGLKCLLNSTALRFHPTTAHPDLTARPALVARVVDVDGNPIAVHRTYLAPYGHGKAAANPQRASLGPVKGGVIRLFEIDPALPLVVGEGIETSASAGLLLKGTAWAALSAGNLEKSLRLPSSVQEVIIAEDPDPPGHRASRGAAKRWVRDGHIVKVATPSGSGDFNDVLRAKAEATHG